MKKYILNMKYVYLMNLMCANYWYLMKWNILCDFIMRTITKLTFLIDRHDVITSNIANYIIYIYQNFQSNNFKMSIILLIILLWGFSCILMSF